MQISTRLLLSGFMSIFFITTGCAPVSTDIRGTITVPLHSSERLSSMTAQLIIKFRNNDFDPSQADFVNDLSRTANAALVYVRPMSGGAHVFRVENISNTAQLTEVIQRLSTRPDVLYAEQDSIMQHQTGK
jgi:hypothetical protein